MNESNNKPIISVSSLSKHYKSRGNKHIISGLFKPDWRFKDAVSDITFNVLPGESVAFLGPNGAGKTTTTKMLTGLIYPSSGELRVLGHKPFERDFNFLSQIGLVMGNRAGLNWDLSASQSFKLSQKIYNIPINSFNNKVAELTSMLGVEKLLDQQVRKLSLGERMKFELIVQILHDPQILFLDEPTIGLDIESKKQVREFLLSQNKAGKTLMLTSHDMDDIKTVCQRVIVIDGGKIIYDNSMSALESHYSQRKFVRLHFSKTTPPKEYFLKFGEIISIKKNVAVLSLKREHTMLQIGEIAESYPIDDVSIEEVPMELIITDLLKQPDSVN